MHKGFSIDRITALTHESGAARDRIPFTLRLTFHTVDNSIIPIVNSRRPLFFFQERSQSLHCFG